MSGTNYRIGVVGIIATVLSGLLTAGCASIVSGSHQSVTFNSNPEGALVTISGRPMGRTPMTASLKRKEDQTLTFSKEGYKPVMMQLETRINGWFWGNILLGGLLGSSTDATSGAVTEYSPSQYLVTLQPAGTGGMEGTTSLSTRQKVKEFIVMGYRDIIQDLARGEGQYWTSLVDLLKVPEAGRADGLKKIRALSEVYANIPEFADRVADLYLKAEAPPPAEAFDPGAAEREKRRGHCPEGQEEIDFNRCYPIKPAFGGH